MTTTTKKKPKLSLYTKELNDIINDALKPRSIIDIQKDFNLSFPFKVKRVIVNDDYPSHFVGITTVGSIELKEIPRGKVQCTDNKIVDIWQDASMPHYIPVLD